MCGCFWIVLFDVVLESFLTCTLRSTQDTSLIVPNLDNHAPYLTVRETFEFAHQCRTGGKHDSVEAKEGVGNGSAMPAGGGDAPASGGQNPNAEGFTENLTIKGLDLSVCADTFVGNESVRGVSGGQRRRVVSQLDCRTY